MARQGGKFEADLPELDLNSSQAHHQKAVEYEHFYSIRGLHPVTQVASTYCAAGTFHKANIKTDTENCATQDLVRQLTSNFKGDQKRSSFMPTVIAMPCSQHFRQLD